MPPDRIEHFVAGNREFGVSRQRVLKLLVHALERERVGQRHGRLAGLQAREGLFFAFDLTF